DKAARGVDGRPFPMGPRIDPIFAKLRESRPEAAQPEPIGTFALDVSPFGVRDVAGGVMDWTATMKDDTPSPDLDVENDGASHPLQAVIRGGAWSLVVLQKHIGQVSYRVVDRPGWVGFRVALQPTSRTSFVQLTSLER